ncbi:hypothetical protein AAF712_012863 [Marasmius tenuissimus]|uniref:Uncharacterized protein n=1 Tax=Marasmius tenuissimus TaxID=585030 RepID=A0ABR2ZGD6_9AGAR
MAPSDNFGDTISNGIQDIAALLPLLGTEQSERHVGEALQNGYLYAAATPLSLFGSLGIVKVSFATLLATMTRLIYGGNWLNDAGFGTTGSVASMVTLERGTKRYGAEIQLERLIEEKHIDNPNMIKNIEWFGWKKGKSPYLSWNLCLVLTSALASIFALAPYVYLALHNPGNALVWIFPSLRAFGSCLLFLLKERHGKPLSNEEKGMLLEERLQKVREEKGMLLEDRIKKLLHLCTLPAPDLVDGHPEAEERRHQHGEDVEAQLPSDRAAHSPADPVLLILQVLLVVGMAMVVAGYVGCFNLVSQTSAKNGPYVSRGTNQDFTLVKLDSGTVKVNWAD